MIKMDFETYAPNDTLDKVLQAVKHIVQLEDDAGIDVAVVMPRPERILDNRTLAQALKGNSRVLGCCQVNPAAGTKEAVAEFEQAVAEWGMRSLKLMPTIYGFPVDGPAVYPLMEKARELGVLVNIHSGSQNCLPLEIAALAERYPDVPVIMDHMGYRNYVRDAITAAQRCPNIYLGTTVAAFEPPMVQRAIDAVGPSRVIFGSNAPALYPDLAVECIKRMKLPQETEDLILGGNLAKLYGMPLNV